MPVPSKIFVQIWVTKVSLYSGTYTGIFKRTQAWPISVPIESEVTVTAVLCISLAIYSEPPINVNGSRVRPTVLRLSPFIKRGLICIGAKSPEFTMKITFSASENQATFIEVPLCW